MLYLVRHAEAGDKLTWTGGSDAYRPLTDTGWRQARWLATQLGDQPLTTIVSSPALRCVQTVQPLAERHALAVQPDPRLHVDGDAGQVTNLLLEATETHTVWCSHRELIGEVITRLRDRGAPIGAEPQWAKGSIWQLDIVAGDVANATYHPPAS